MAPTRATAPEMSRTDSNDRPSGPPRLALAGNKPTWRERQAAKEVVEAGGGSPAPAAPPTDAGEEAVQSRRTGYLPPARRGADGIAPPAPRGRPDSGPPRPSLDRGDSTSQEPTARWRPGPRSGTVGRDDSPADGPSPRFLQGLKAPSGGREASPADGARPTSSTGADAQASDPTNKPAAGKYVPVHLRNK